MIDPSIPARPDLTSDAVIVHACEQVQDVLVSWVERRLAKKTSPEAVIAFAASAIQVTGADGFRAAHKLMESCGWPSDFELCRILETACERLPFCRRLAVSEWVMKHGVRFPATAGDQIEWKAQGRTRTGLVHELVPRDAAAIVRPMVGAALAGDMILIVAEQVTTAHVVTKTG